MRILQAIGGFYPGQEWGGPPQTTLTLCKGLQQRGHDVSVLTTNLLNYHERMSKNTFQADWEGVPVTYLHAHWRGKRPDSTGFVWSYDFATMRKEFEDADIIHIQGYRDFMFFAATMFSSVLHTPYVVHAHGALPSELGRRRLKTIIDTTMGGFMLRQAKACIALSNQEANDYLRRGVAEDRIHKIFNPFDPLLCPTIPSPNVFRTRFNVSSDTKIVLFLARLHVKKGLKLLIDAISGMQSSDNFLVFIVGPDDGYEEDARKLVHDLEIENRVVFVGPLYGLEKFEAFSAADIFVLPTMGVEGLPTTIIESCYTGTPMIVTRRTEIAELVDGEVGIAIDHDVEHLRQALATLLNDDNMRNLYSKNCPAFMRKHFDFDTLVKQTEQVYLSCLQQSCFGE
jgi:glycosyltransferase involved in cell wall biosynthesis